LPYINCTVQHTTFINQVTQKFKTKQIQKGWTFLGLLKTVFKPMQFRVIAKS